MVSQLHIGQRHNFTPIKMNFNKTIRNGNVIATIIMVTMALTYMLLVIKPQSVYAPYTTDHGEKPFGAGELEIPREFQDRHAVTVGEKTFLKIFKRNETHDAEVAAFLEKQEHIYRKRKESLEEACVKHSPRSPLTLDSSTGMLWNYEHRLAYCPNFKTGTTTWMNVLLELVPWLVTQSRSNWRWHLHYNAAEEFFQMPKWKWPGGRAVFDRLFSFVFVRHPFVRLVSAYQDKIVDHALYDFFDRFHQSHNTTDLLSKQHSFRTFVSVFLNSTKSRGLYQRYFKVNPHVQTYWSKCALCHLNFTVIGKTETSAEDFRYITTKAKLLDSLPADMDLNSSSGGSTEKLAKHYFSTLRKGEVEELYKYYKFDFEAFGYDYSEYLDVAKADK